jgi:DNA-binding response OmpR family regulator
MRLAGIASSVDEAEPLLADGVDVILLDLRLGTDSGFRLLVEHPQSPTAVVVV